MRPGSADIKLPWELARCQHWPLLGQAYRLTGDDRFARRDRPRARRLHGGQPGRHRRQLDLHDGRRACARRTGPSAWNWCARVRPDDGFWREAYEALFDHGVFIERQPREHLRGDQQPFPQQRRRPVLSSRAVFDDLPRGRGCGTGSAARWLAQEMDVQVLPDGADYESSVPYHRLVTELFLGAARLAEHGRARRCPHGSSPGCAHMVEFLAAVLRPDGLMPQVGDADDGRLHMLSGYGDVAAAGSAASVRAGGLLLREPTTGRAGAGEWQRWEAAWWGFDCSAARPASAGAVLARCAHFPHAGHDRHARANDDYLLITNGIVGTSGFGNHKHNDLLGFEYHAAGAPVIVDPGSYVYTSDPDARNLFRSTRSHNTAQRGRSRAERVPARVAVPDVREGVTRASGSVREEAMSLSIAVVNSGYARPGTPLVHERTFRLRLVGQER